MKHIKLGLAGLVLLLSALWLAADPLALTRYEWFALRTSLIYYTGIVGIGVMSVAMVLAFRPVVFEPWLGGLDKMYRLHKWLGITGLLMAIAHWLWMQVPKWLVEAGWIVRPARHRAPEETVALFRFFQSQRGLAEGVGEWAFYAVVVLLGLALVKQFPYRYFFQIHRLMPIAFLALVFHAAVLMKFSYWSQPVGPVLGLMMLAGSLAAMGILIGKVGWRRRAVGLIDDITHYKDVRVLQVTLQLKGRWRGHAAGQFAFVTFDGREGAHPFTISSPWTGDGRLVFLIKELGDYTRALPKSARVGDVVQVEGPYGQFTFAGRKPQQIWVGGGIGITPFIARLQALAHAPDGKPVDLFYATRVPCDDAITGLQTEAKKAGVRLHVVVEGRDGRLTADRICLAVPAWKSCDVWFCGPSGFGKALRADFLARGVEPADFHHELFEMR